MGKKENQRSNSTFLNCRKCLPSLNRPSEMKRNTSTPTHTTMQFQNTGDKEDSPTADRNQKNQEIKMALTSQKQHQQATQWCLPNFECKQLVTELYTQPGKKTSSEPGDLKTRTFYAKLAPGQHTPLSQGVLREVGEMHEEGQKAQTSSCPVVK